MNIVKTILFFSILLSVSVISYSKKGEVVERTGKIFPSEFEFSAQRVVAPKGVLQPCITVVESVGQAIRSFKDAKKHFVKLVVSGRAIDFVAFHQRSSFSVSKSRRILPFYIGYHRLVI